jgi:hypothetical protein
MLVSERIELCKNEMAPARKELLLVFELIIRRPVS